MEIDKKIILKLIKTLEDLKKSVKDISDLNNDDDINVSKKEEEVIGTVVKSPLVGTAYLAPEPGAKQFSEVGKRVKKGDTIMIVEAMKTMNHVPSNVDGIIKKVCVEDGEPVEFGQNLIIIE
tara:strand:+ start:407 stop:772 length:366 start_codon:yes stop_codon:yes gene_type:complete